MKISPKLNEINFNILLKIVYTDATETRYKSRAIHYASFSFMWRRQRIEKGKGGGGGKQQCACKQICINVGFSFLRLKLRYLNKCVRMYVVVSLLLCLSWHFEAGQKGRHYEILYMRDSTMI